MNFQHHPEIWNRFPQLNACAVWARGIQPNAQAEAALQPLLVQARERLKQAGGSEGQIPSVQAWRRGFSQLGLKPTQYRCAAESLLRRLRKDGDMPRISPLVDTLNALSMAHAIPIAVFDLNQVLGNMEVRLATGAERFMTVSNEEETPEPGEVLFVDDAGYAHARRWCHRQSACSAVKPSTDEVLIVAEALHTDAGQDIETLLAEITSQLVEGFGAMTTQGILSARAPQFSFGSSETKPLLAQSSWGRPPMQKPEPLGAVLKSLFAHKAWANEELFSAIASVDNAANGAGVHKAARVLNHVFVVDSIFQAHLKGEPHNFEASNTKEAPTPQSLWAAVQVLDRWFQRYVDGLSSKALHEKLVFRFTDGDTGSMSREEVLMHVITHGGYHRGAAGEILRGAGVAPPRDLYTRFLHLSEPSRRG